MKMIINYGTELSKEDIDKIKDIKGLDTEEVDGQLIIYHKKEELW